MRKVKKIVAMATVSVMLVMSLMGCSNKEKTTDTSVGNTGADTKKSGEVVTLRMWGGVPPEAGPQKVCDNFNELYKDKGIQVEYERFVNDETGNMKLETNLLSGTGVDIYVTYSIDALAKRAEGGMALDLTEMMNKDGFNIEENFGSMAKAYYVDGKAYAIPTKLDQYGIVLNKTMFDEAGITIPTEWTFDEFREVAKKLTHGEGQDKVYGMFWNTQQDLTAPFTYLAVQTLGGDYFYKNDKESNLDNPVMIKSVELLNNMMNVDGSSPTHTDSVTQKLSQEGLFLTGKSAMTVGPWMVRNIKNLTDYPHDFETAFAPYPVVEKGQRNFTQGGYGDLLSISPKSEHTKEAWEFVKWYATEGMLPVTEGGRVPASSTFDSKVVAETFLKGAEEHMDLDSTMKILITPADNYAVPSITNHIAEVKKIVVEEVEGILIGSQTTEEGMLKAKERSDDIIKE